MSILDTLLSKKVKEVNVDPSFLSQAEEIRQLRRRIEELEKKMENERHENERKARLLAETEGQNKVLRKENERLKQELLSASKE